MAIIHALSRWVDPNDKTSLYGRLYHLRQSVQRIARTEPTSSRVLWCDSDQQLALSWAFMDKRLFSLSNIRCTAFQEVEGLNRACRELSHWIYGTSVFLHFRLNHLWTTGTLHRCSTATKTWASLLLQLPDFGVIWWKPFHAEITTSPWYLKDRKHFLNALLRHCT